MIVRVKKGICPLCHRITDLSFHHLIPKKLHRRNFYRKNHTKEQLNSGINICRKCHSGIHTVYDEKTLANKFNTLEAVQSDDDLIRHFKWVGKQRIKSE